MEWNFTWIYIIIPAKFDRKYQLYWLFHFQLTAFALIQIMDLHNLYLKINHLLYIISGKLLLLMVGVYIIN